jgi:hypothetical protein
MCLVLLEGLEPSSRRLQGGASPAKFQQHYSVGPGFFSLRPFSVLPQRGQRPLCPTNLLSQPHQYLALVGCRDWILFGFLSFMSLVLLQGFEPRSRSVRKRASPSMFQQLGILGLYLRCTKKPSV